MIKLWLILLLKTSKAFGLQNFYFQVVFNEQFYADEESLRLKRPLSWNWLNVSIKFLTDTRQKKRVDYTTEVDVLGHFAARQF